MTFWPSLIQIIWISAGMRKHDALTNSSGGCVIVNDKQNKSQAGSRVSDTVLSIEGSRGVDFSSCGLAAFVSWSIHIPRL